MDNGMMTETRAAIVVEGVVANIILVDPSSEWAPDAGELIRDVPDTVGIGDSYSDGFFTPPPPVLPPVPSFITRRQCARVMFERGMITGPEMIAMTSTGTPPAMIEVVFAAMPKIEQWVSRADFAADTYERSNPLLVGIMMNSGATPMDIDNFFRDAAFL